MPHRSQCSSAGDNPLDPNYLPPHYREEYRIAIDALVDADLEGYYGFLQAADMVGFLSQTEIEYIKHMVRTPHSTVQPDRRYMAEDADGSSDTYWPVHSDHDAPSLDLGWPQQSRFAGPTEVTTLVNPSDPEMPSIKEQVRRMIKSAQEVVAVVMDMFTDVDIFFDILTAAMRGVAVYILLDELNAHHFVSMVNNCRVNLDEIKCMRVRTVCGNTYFCHTGKSFKGQMMDRFILVDCKAVLTGNYSFMWSFEKIHRCLAHLFLGQLVTTFDEEFRILFAHSEPLVVENILPNMSHYSNVHESHLNMDNAHMLKREYPPIHPEWADHSAEKHINVGHQMFPFRNPEPYGAEKNPPIQRHMNLHAVQQFRGDQPFIEHGRQMRGPFEMAGFKRHGYPDVPEYEYMPPQNQPTIRGKPFMEGVVPKGSHFAREPGLYQGAGLQPDYDMYGRFRDQGYHMDQFSGAGYPHEVNEAEPPGAYDHVQRFLRSQSPMEEGLGAGNLVPPAQSNVRRHSMGQSYACQPSPTSPNLPDQKRLFNANRKPQDVSQKQGLRDWRISSYLSACDDGEENDFSELEGSDLCDNVPCFVQEGSGGPVGAKIRLGNTEFNRMPSSRNNPPFIQIQNSSPPPYSLAYHPPDLSDNSKITPTTTSESSCTTEGDKVEETQYKKPKETNRFGEEFLRSKPIHNVQRSSRLRHSLIFSSNLELNTSDTSKDILGEKDGDEASKLSARVSQILDKRRGSAREPFQWRNFIKSARVDDQAMESAHSESSLNKIGVSNVDNSQVLLQEKKLPETVQSAVLEEQSEKDDSQIKPKSSSFVDMNDPDSRFRYFKELAAKRKAELAAVKTSQSKPEKASKMLDAPDKPLTSDAEDKGIVTTPEIQNTKCEESGADIPETIQTAIQDEKSRRNESSEWQRSFSFLDMNDPDCRFSYFKELAAKRKAELAEVKTSQSKQEKAPKTSDTPDKPSMSDTEKKAALTTPEIQDTKCEKSGADIPETVQSAIQDEKSRRNESNEWQRSFSFLDMNDPDCRYKYFKELAAKRKAELAAVKTSQSKPEKAPKTSDASEKPSMSDAEKKAALTTSEIQNTKHEESSPDILHRATDAEKIRFKKKLAEESALSKNYFLKDTAPSLNPVMETNTESKNLSTFNLPSKPSSKDAESLSVPAPFKASSSQNQVGSNPLKTASTETMHSQNHIPKEISPSHVDLTDSCPPVKLSQTKCLSPLTITPNESSHQPTPKESESGQKYSATEPECFQQPTVTEADSSQEPATSGVHSSKIPATEKNEHAQKHTATEAASFQHQTAGGVHSCQQPTEEESASSQCVAAIDKNPSEKPFIMKAESSQQLPATEPAKPAELHTTTEAKPLQEPPAFKHKSFEHTTVTETDFLQQPNTTVSESLQHPSATKTDSFHQPSAAESKHSEQSTQTEAKASQLSILAKTDSTQQPNALGVQSSKIQSAREKEHAQKPTATETESVLLFTLAETDSLQQPIAAVNESLQHPAATEANFSQKPIALGVQSYKIPSATENEHVHKLSATETEHAQKPIEAKVESLQHPITAENKDTQKPTAMEVDSSQHPLATENEVPKKPTVTGNEDAQKPAAAQPQSVQNPPASENEHAEKPAAAEAKSVQNPPISENKDGKKPAPAEAKSVQNPPATKHEDAPKPAAAQSQSVRTPPASKNEDAQKPAAAESQSVQNPPASKNEDAQKPATAEVQSVTNPTSTENDNAQKPSAAEAKSVQNPAEVQSVTIPTSTENDNAQKPSAAEAKSVQNPPATEKEDGPKPTAMEADSSQNLPTTNNEQKPPATEAKEANSSAESELVQKSATEQVNDFQQPVVNVADSSQTSTSTVDASNLSQQATAGERQSSEPSTAKGEDFFQESNALKEDSSQRPTTTSNVPSQHPTETDYFKQPTQSRKDSSQSPAETGTDSVMVTEKESSQNPTPVVLDTSKHPIATETPASVCVSASHPPFKVTLSPQTISFTDTTPADSHILFEKGVVDMSTTEPYLDKNILIPAVNTLKNGEVSPPEQSPKDGESFPKVVLPITTSSEPSPSEESSSSKIKQKDDNSCQDISKQGSIPATDITPGENVLSQNITTDLSSSPEHSQTDTLSDVAKPCPHTDDNKMELNYSLEQTRDKPSISPIIKDTEPCLSRDIKEQYNSSARPEVLQLAEVFPALDPVQIDETKQTIPDLAGLSEQSEISLTTNSTENAISQSNVTENSKLSTHQSSTANVLSCSNLRDDTKVLLEQISAKNQSRSSQSKQTPANEEKEEGVRSVEQQLSTFSVGTWSSKSSPEEREMLLKKMEKMRKERKVYSRFEASC